ncbi:MAG: DNA polymerase III subunit delta' [Suipraeoptans sp.]
MDSFKDVVGHNDIINYIRSAIESDKISHAYIMNGRRGSGKKTMAKLFAMTLQCEKSNADPCGVCQSCIQAESGNHPDIIKVSHDKPNTIGVDDIREQINNTVTIKPYKGPYKIYIIDQADLMTEQAQNALLKTLEEPPEYAMFFLLTENANILLDTIKSRCVMLKFRNLQDALVKNYLMETMGIPDYKADICAAFAQGNLGQAIMLANSEHFNEIKDEAIPLLKHVRDMEVNEIISAVKRATVYKLEVADFLDIITIWYRDVLLYKATNDINKVIFKDEVSIIKEEARVSSYEGVEEILKAIDAAKERLKANVNFDLVMELLFLTMKEN